MSQRDLKQDIFLLIGTVFLALIIGAGVFSFVEGWTIFDSFYFVTMTATTVGYGDFTPSTHLGKFLTILFSLSIIPFVLYTFSFVAKAQMQGVYRKIHHLEKQQKEQEVEINDAEKKLNRQKAELKEQKENLKKEKMEIKAQKKELKKEEKMNQIQNKEILEQDQELDAVEEVMEDALKR